MTRQIRIVSNSTGTNDEGNTVIGPPGAGRPRRLAALALALLVLNSALTFQNRWPTAGVRWVPELSIELAALLLVLALVAAWRGTPGRAMRNALAGGYLVRLSRPRPRALSGCHRPGLDGAIHQLVLGQPARSPRGGHARGQHRRLAVDAGRFGAAGLPGRVGRHPALGVRFGRGRARSRPRWLDRLACAGWVRWRWRCWRCTAPAG